MFCFNVGSTTSVSLEIESFGFCCATNDSLCFCYLLFSGVDIALLLANAMKSFFRKFSL